MRRRGEQVLDVVLVLETRPTHPLAAASLLAERVVLDGLHVALVREHDDDFFVLDEVEVFDVTGVEGDLRTPALCELLPHLGEFFLDDLVLLRVAVEDRLEGRDARLEFGVLVEQLLVFELGEAPQRHVEDVLGLDLAELERLRHEARPRGVRVGRGADQRDDLVDGVERAQQPLDDVGPITVLADPVLSAPGDDDHLVFDVHPQRLAQVEQARHAVDERQQVHREVRLHRRVLIELVQHDL